LKKRNVIFLSVLTVLLTVIFSCESRPKLYIYNWASYIPDSVIKKFEEKYKVRVIYDVFATNEEMYAKLKSGGTGYDIVFPSKDHVPIMIREGMIIKLDHSKLDNIIYIDERVKRLMDYDPKMEYSIPYFYGASGVMVNTEKVRGFERSWSIFAKNDFPAKRMTMLDDMREVMGAALKYLGYSINSTNPAEIEEATNLINTQWKPNLIKFDADTFGSGFANGEFWVVHCYPENVYDEIKENKKLLNNMVFFFPREGGPSYIDNMVILKDSKSIDLAHKFINFIHEPEIYAEFADTFGLPSTVNTEARKLKKGFSLYNESELFNTDTIELIEDVGEYLDLYTKAWFNSIITGQ